MGVQLTHTELYENSNALLAQAKALVTAEDANAESDEKAARMIDDAKAMRKRSDALKELDTMIVEAKANPQMPSTPAQVATTDGYKTFGEYLIDIWKVAAYNQWDERLKKSKASFPDDPTPAFDMKSQGWVETKDKESKTLAESVGASGGFTVKPEYRSELFMLSEFTRYVRERAMVMPMMARQILMPSLDQTGSTAGVTNIYGGVIPTWTEESAEKTETEPDFRQISIVAHKLALYTEASDELLADSAIGLETLLYGLFGGAIANEEEWVFINGHGAGQPMGINHAGCASTYRQTRAAAGAISITDVFNMVSHFMGQSPIWLAHQSTMPQILGLNGPATNPSYVWINNAREGAPTTLMGYPVHFIENTVTLGSEGDLILADWSKYIIGDRQQTTIDSSKHFKFRNDLTAWRAVHRVGGRPWLSDLLTLRDGSTEVSPFVVLDDGVTPT